MTTEKLEKANNANRKRENAESAIKQIKKVLNEYPKVNNLQIRIGYNATHMPIPEYMYGHLSALILAEWEKQLHEATNELENL